MKLIPYSPTARTVLDCGENKILYGFFDEPDTPLDTEVPMWDMTQEHNGFKDY